MLKLVSKYQNPSGPINWIKDRLTKFAKTMGEVNPQGANSFVPAGSLKIVDLSQAANVGNVRTSDGSYRTYNDNEKSTAKTQLGVMGVGSALSPLGLGIFTPAGLHLIGSAAGSMAAGMTADEASKAFTGRTFGENARHSIKLFTGFEGFKNPYANAFYNLATDFTNPWYLYAPEGKYFLFKTSKPKPVTENVRNDMQINVPQVLEGTYSPYSTSGNAIDALQNIPIILKENSYFIPKPGLLNTYDNIGNDLRDKLKILWNNDIIDYISNEELGKLSMLRRKKINESLYNIPEIVLGYNNQYTAFRNGELVGTLLTSQNGNNGILIPQMITKNGKNNSNISELLYNSALSDVVFTPNGKMYRGNIRSGDKLLMPEVTTHVTSKYPITNISNTGEHAWPIKTAINNKVNIDFGNGWASRPEYSEQLLNAIDVNLRMKLLNLPVVLLNKPTYVPMFKDEQLFDFNNLKHGYIDISSIYKHGGKLHK